MNRQRIALIVGLGGVALLVVALAFAGGLGPFSDDGDGDVGDVPTATPTPTAGTGDGGADGGTGGAAGGEGGERDEAGDTVAEPRRPFAFRIDSVETCGRTCRDVTATLENQQDRRATGVTVHTRMHAGNGTDGDVVWEGTHEVGTLDTGDADTETQRVRLSYFDALAVQREDGWVTILLTVETDRGTVTFQQRRNVA